MSSPSYTVPQTPEEATARAQRIVDEYGITPTAILAASLGMSAKNIQAIVRKLRDRGLLPPPVPHTHTAAATAPPPCRKYSSKILFSRLTLRNGSTGSAVPPAAPLPTPRQRRKVRRARWSQAEDAHLAEMIAVNMNPRAIRAALVATHGTLRTVKAIKFRIALVRAIANRTVE